MSSSLSCCASNPQIMKHWYVCFVYILNDNIECLFFAFRCFQYLRSYHHDHCLKPVVPIYSTSTLECHLAVVTHDIKICFIILMMPNCCAFCQCWKPRQHHNSSLLGLFETNPDLQPTSRHSGYCATMMVIDVKSTIFFQKLIIHFIWIEIHWTTNLEPFPANRI